MTVNRHDVEAQYCQALLNQPAVSRIALADGRLVAVKDIYVNRTLLHEVVQKQPEREFSGGQRVGAKNAEPQREITVKLPVDLWPKLRDERVVLVEGPAGMGKSTLTKHLVQESGTQHLIPIWIPFRQFVASGFSIAEYFDQYYGPWLGLSDLRVPDRNVGMGRDRSVGQWCYDQWQSGLGVLILDGLDEVFRHDERVTALKALPITGTGRTRPATILTSRPLSQSLPLQMAKVEVQGLTPSDQRKFIEQYRASLRLTDEHITRFTSTTQKQGRSQSLLMRPGHLIQILSTYAKTNTILDTETAVLDSLLKSRLTITGRSQPPVEGDDAKKKRQVLMSLALHLLACRHGQRHTRAQLLALIQQVLYEQKQADAPLFPLSQATALLNDFVRNSGLLTEVEPEVYEFETVIWLQYLTGSALANEQTVATLNLAKNQVLDFLDKKAWDPEWEPVLKSWVGNTGNPFPLFRRLMNKRRDDLARHRLGVAWRCLSEVLPEQKQHLRYRRLARRFPQAAFALWKSNARQDTVQLVTTSFGMKWVETEIGQTKLLALLESDRSMCRAAIDALGELSVAMPGIVQEALVARLADSNKDVRTAAVKAIRGLGMAMPVAMQQVLVARLADSNGAMREGVAMALGSLGAAMADFVQEALVTRLADSDGRVCAAAASALGELGTAMPVAVQEALVARLADLNGFVCRVAVGEALGKLKTAMPVAVQEALVVRLVDWNEDVRVAAATAFRELGPAMPVAVQQVLVAWLTNSSESKRAAAVEALSWLGPTTSGSVQEALGALLKDGDVLVVSAAARFLGNLGQGMLVSVQEALVARLVYSDYNDVWDAAATSLSWLGPTMSASVQEVLVARLGDSHKGMRQAAARALWELGPAMLVSVQEALAARLNDSHAGVRQNAAVALSYLGPAMPVWLQEALVAGLNDSHAGVRQAAAHSLWELGPAMSISVQQALLSRLADQDKDVRRHAASVLSRLGPAMSISVQDVLVARLKYGDEAARNEAAWAVMGLGAAMPVAVQQALIARLADPYEVVRKAAATALSYAQHQGLRLFVGGATVPPGRLVSTLSATAPFPDSCHQGVLHAPAALTPPVFSRLPLTAL